MSKLRPTLLALAALLTLALPRVAQAEQAPMTGAALKAVCQEAKGDAYRLFVTPEVARQGAELAVQAVAMGPNNPWGGPLPLACLRTWKLSAPAAATLSADHGKLVIAAAAAPGTRVTLTAEFDGKTAAVEFTIVARDAVVLTGFWTEVGDEACPASDNPLRELRFLADGKFEVTWMPFERYVDYWGTYDFNAATGAISFTVTGGNHLPENADLTGVATLGLDGLLRFTEMSFGQAFANEPPTPMAGCPYIFKSR